MSTRAAATSEPTKKKFGKNLNKLAKPPAPPISSNVNRQSSRSGLLLLSTKRSSGSGAGGSGLLSSKAVPKPLNTPSLKNEGAPTTHDVLLTAALNSESNSQQFQTPAQAWSNSSGADKPAQKSHATLAPNGGVSSGYHALVGSPPGDEIKSLENADFSSKSNIDDSIAHNRTHSGDGRYPFEEHGVDIRRQDEIRHHRDRWHHEVETPMTEFRHRSSDGNRLGDGLDNRASEGFGRQRDILEYRGDSMLEPDERSGFNSRPNREQLERRRIDDENRPSEHKEKGSKRSQEIDSSSARDATMENRGHQEENIHSTQDGKRTAGSRYPEQATVHQKQEILLESLGKIHSGKSETSFDRNNTPQQRTPRTLFDPNRPFSSMVGAKVQSPHDGKEWNRNLQTAHDSKEITSPEITPARDAFHRRDSEDHTYTVIHLTSYEDRDRGERKSNAGPRMLFDHKSGSMIAVPADGGIKRKEPKEKKKGRRERERDGKDRDGSTNPKNRSGENYVNGVGHSKGKRANDPQSLRKDKRRNEKDSKVNSEAFDMNGVKSKRPGGKVPNGCKSGAFDNMRMPRTCGVLYVVDEIGKYSCADGCDPDLGYGAHSVPGGRVRNPQAHAAFRAEEQARLSPVSAPPPAAERLVRGSGQGNVSATLDQKLFSSSGFSSSILPTSRLVSHEPTDAFNTAMSPRSLSANHTNEQEPPLNAPHFDDWVKPNEKIELVTGAEESTTLQATAHSWVPSHAALQATLGPRPNVNDETETDVLTNRIPPRKDNLDTTMVGLGFDPKNVDSVMTSPSLRPETQEKGLDDLDLFSLTLVPPASSEGTTTTGGGIFGPLGSSTWGANPTEGGLGDWDTLLRSEDSPLRTVKPNGSTINASPFVSLNGNDTWGLTGLAGIGGTTFSSSDKSTGNVD